MKSHFGQRPCIIMLNCECFIKNWSLSYIVLVPGSFHFDSVHMKIEDFEVLYLTYFNSNFNSFHDDVIDRVDLLLV